MNGPEQWNPDNGYRMPPGYPPYYGHPPHRKSKWIAGLLSLLIPGVGHMYLGKMIKAIFIMLMIAGAIMGIVQMSMYYVNVISIVLLSFLLLIIYFYSLFDSIQSADRVNERLAAKWQSAQGYSNGQPFYYPYPPYSQPQQPHRQPQPPHMQQQPQRQPQPPHMQQQPQRQPQPPQMPQQPQQLFPELRGMSLKKMALLAIVVVFVCLLAQETWTEWKFDSTLSIIGAVLLIGAGFAMWIWEARGPQGHQDAVQPPRPTGPQSSNGSEH